MNPIEINFELETFSFCEGHDILICCRFSVGCWDTGKKNTSSIRDHKRNSSIYETFHISLHKRNSVIISEIIGLTCRALILRVMSFRKFCKGILRTLSLERNVENGLLIIIWHHQSSLCMITNHSETLGIPRIQVQKQTAISNSFQVEVYH